MAAGQHIVNMATSFTTVALTIIKNAVEVTEFAPLMANEKVPALASKPSTVGVSEEDSIDSAITGTVRIQDTSEKVEYKTTAGWKQISDDISNASTYVNYSVLTDMKDPTGWVNPDGITCEYSTTNRTITLTGDLSYYWNGVKKQLNSPWTSTAHTDADGQYFLYSTDGLTFSWSTDPWSFYHIMVAKAFVSTSPAYKGALKETHGLMPWQVHEELHETVSAYRDSGGALTGGTYQENTQTDVAITPGFDAAVVQDEDLHTTIAEWTQGTYTTMYIGASSKATFDTAASFPFRYAAAGYIKYNTPSTGAETEGSTLKFYNVYQILIPVTADTDSQKYRMVMLQPQREFTSLATAQAEDPRSLSLGDLTTTAPEFVIYARITYGTSASYGTTGKVIIPTGGITYIAGSKLSQISISGFTNPIHNDTTGLQGGTTGEYYHLTSAQHSGLTGGGETALHTHAGGSGGLTQSQVLARTLGG